MPELAKTVQSVILTKKFKIRNSIGTIIARTFIGVQSDARHLQKEDKNQKARKTLTPKQFEFNSAAYVIGAERRPATINKAAKIF
ncbi:MAG: hypothetical protein QME62_14455 [Armatimonadota bacterium]|nr:hypothetical protein [Armatimonadota bacterium]